MAKKIRQNIRIDEVDDGGFRIQSAGRDPALNKERVGTDADDAKEIAHQLVDLVFSEPEPAKPAEPAESVAPASRKSAKKA